MKAFALSSLLVAAAANAHTIFQKVSVDGKDLGQLKGIRAPTNNNPVTNVNDGAIACGPAGSTSRDVLDVPAGAKVGTYWGHVIGGEQMPGDRDHPIAASHKGPVMVYLAKVDNAATATTSGLKWFKIAEDGMDSGAKWGVDRMIEGRGWWYFNMPQCIAPGNYLMKAELIALHNAYSQGGAQFYLSCAQINVTGGGTFSGSNFVSFPGAYKASDPGITVSIYSPSGLTNNNGQPYIIPGPRVDACPAGSTPAGTSPEAPAAAAPPAAGGAGAPLFGQCGGTGWAGPTTCAEGTCTATNEWYSQCSP